MIRSILTCVALSISFVAAGPSRAEACECGRGHISPKKTCHKSPCDCPRCDHRDGATPDSRAKDVVNAAKPKPAPKQPNEPAEVAR